MNSINKIHGTVIHDARISEESAEAISELTKDDVKALQLGQKNVYLKVDEDNLKTFLEKATFTESKLGPYTYYRISDLTNYTLRFACASINTDFADKLALYIIPENREFEFENNGAKYKFKWSHEILFNFGKFEVAETNNITSGLGISSDHSGYTLSSISDYTNVLNLTEKVLKLDLDETTSTYQYISTEADYVHIATISSYKKYVIASGAATESDIDVKTPLFGDYYTDNYGTHHYIKYDYTITKIEE